MSILREAEQSHMRRAHDVEAEEELAKETIRAFKAGLHGEEHDNPFTEAEDAAESGNTRPVEAEPNTREKDARPA